jgi:hypothetical protein
LIEHIHSKIRSDQEATLTEKVGLEIEKIIETLRQIDDQPNYFENAEQIHKLCNGAISIPTIKFYIFNKRALHSSQVEEVE